MVFCAALELRRASGVPSAGAGGNRPLLFVIARSRRRRGNPLTKFEILISKL